jgi:hypothetical protein
MNPHDVVKLGWILMIGGILNGIINFFRQDVAAYWRFLNFAIIFTGFICTIKPKEVAELLGKVFG